MFGSMFKAVSSVQECAAFNMRGWYKANKDLSSYYQTISKRLFDSESDESVTSHKENSENKMKQ